MGRVVARQKESGELSHESHKIPDVGRLHLCAAGWRPDAIDDAIVEGKLYLNNSYVAQTLWATNKAGFIASADRNWPLYPKKSGAECLCLAASPSKKRAGSSPVLGQRRFRPQSMSVAREWPEAIRATAVWRP